MTILPASRIWERGKDLAAFPRRSALGSGRRLFLRLYVGTDAPHLHFECLRSSGFLEDLGASIFIHTRTKRANLARDSRPRLGFDPGAVGVRSLSFLNPGPGRARTRGRDVDPSWDAVEWQR